MTTTLSCNFPGCEAKDLKPETALVPAIQAIKQAENGRPVTPAILASHVFCQEHGVLGRAQAGGMFSYTETVKRLEQRAAERTQAKTFFAKYGAPAQKPAAPGKPVAQQNRPNPRSDAMKVALVNAGVVKPATQKVVELPVAAAASA